MNPSPHYRQASEKLSRFQFQPKQDRTPLTHQELDALADEAVQDLRHDMVLHGHAPDGVARRTFTCHDCSSASTCPFAYDPYNTDGDCIASK